MPDTENGLITEREHFTSWRRKVMAYPADNDTKPTWERIKTRPPRYNVRSVLEEPDTDKKHASRAHPIQEPPAVSACDQYFGKMNGVDEQGLSRVPTVQLPPLQRHVVSKPVGIMILLLHLQPNAVKIGT